MYFMFRSYLFFVARVNVAFRHTQWLVDCFFAKLRAFLGLRSQKLNTSMRENPNWQIWRMGRNSNLDQVARERVLLALKVLTSTLDARSKDQATQEEVAELRSYIGPEAMSLSDDQVACLIIQREIQRQDG